MRIGIFGGSFNPPHNMHKKIMMELLCNEYIDKGIYVPTGDSYNKKDLISFIKNSLYCSKFLTECKYVLKYIFLYLFSILFKTSLICSSKTSVSLTIYVKKLA